MNTAKCDSEKDLGITIDSELNYGIHIDMASKKANGIMNVIRRTLTCMDFKCFCLLYKTSSGIWSYFLDSI